jgi:hypothetical protein
MACLTPQQRVLSRFGEKLLRKTAWFHIKKYAKFAAISGVATSVQFLRSVRNGIFNSTA